MLTVLYSSVVFYNRMLGPYWRSGSAMRPALGPCMYAVQVLLATQSILFLHAGMHPSTANTLAGNRSM